MVTNKSCMMTPSKLKTSPANQITKNVIERPSPLLRL